jgi:hypothetical protein
VVVSLEERRLLDVEQEMSQVLVVAGELTPVGVELGGRGDEVRDEADGRLPGRLLLERKVRHVRGRTG